MDSKLDFKQKFYSSAQMAQFAPSLSRIRFAQYRCTSGLCARLTCGTSFPFFSRHIRAELSIQKLRFRKHASNGERNGGSRCMKMVKDTNQVCRFQIYGHARQDSRVGTTRRSPRKIHRRPALTAPRLAAGMHRSRGHVADAGSRFGAQDPSRRRCSISVRRYRASTHVRPRSPLVARRGEAYLKSTGLATPLLRPDPEFFIVDPSLGLRHVGLVVQMNPRSAVPSVRLEAATWVTARVQRRLFPVRRWTPS